MRQPASQRRPVVRLYSCSPALPPPLRHGLSDVNGDIVPHAVYLVAIPFVNALLRSAVDRVHPRSGESRRRQFADGRAIECPDGVLAQFGKRLVVIDVVFTLERNKWKILCHLPLR